MSGDPVLQAMHEQATQLSRVILQRAEVFADNGWPLDDSSDRKLLSDLQDSIRRRQAEADASRLSAADHRGA